MQIVSKSFEGYGTSEKFARDNLASEVRKAIRNEIIHNHANFTDETVVGEIFDLLDLGTTELSAQESGFMVKATVKFKDAAMSKDNVRSASNRITIPLTPSTNEKNGFTKGGIDLNAFNLHLNIKRDGNGVPLPVSQQEINNIHIDGLVPVILGNMIPAAESSVFAQFDGFHVFCDNNIN